MEVIDKATIIHYHRNRIKHFSEGPMSLGWKCEESQRRRFEVLVHKTDFNNSSTLDIGCGRGDFKRYLDSLYTDFSYVGIDQVPEFISDASSRYQNVSNTIFFQADFSAVDLPKADYVVASGALSYRSKDTEYYSEMIARMYISTKRILAFNMLDAETFPDHPILVGHDVEKIIRFCKSLSPHIELIRDYLPHDFTVIMHRN